MSNPSIHPIRQSGQRLPFGTVTFLFTDIESSTKLWEKHPEEMKSVLAKHDSLLKEAVESKNGQIIKTTGDGVHAVFSTAVDAVNAAMDGQQHLASIPSYSTTEVEIKVRMGLHTGEAELRDGDYYGGTLNRAARIMSIGHGGQILLSDVTAQLVREHLPESTSLLDLGLHHLKGLRQPERIYQLNATDHQQVFPPLNSIPIATNNLPAQLTTFIGRENELSQAQSKLANAKLLTLIGPGGTGKTRLSIQIGSEQISNFKDGVWMVELAPISDAVNIITAIASVFDLREVQNIPLTTILLDYLRAKELLLILDNCEHIVEASAQIADQLLHISPGLKIIASSREALGIDGETIYRVPSLNDDESTRLFVERATKAEPRFKLTDKNASAIAQICSRLDGIPLAIELAAARVKLFTPEQIAERLDDSFKLLTGGSRTALERQQTLRALIDWSYITLNEVEQRALRHLAVFSGGWTFEAAESVIGESEAMDGLMGLVNKSLVNVEEQEHESRYRFLETIRQYAMEKLSEAGESEQARDRHYDYIMNIAQGSNKDIFGMESITWLDQMDAEHDNLRAALEWSISSDPVKALSLANAVGGFWNARDYNSETGALCTTILAKTELTENVDELRAKVFGILAWTSITSGHPKDAREAAKQGIKLARKVNDTKTLARCSSILALTSIFLGDIDTALRVAKEAEELARRENHHLELSMILTTLAQAIYSTTHDAPRAKAYVEEAVKIGKAAGSQWTDTMSAFGMAQVAGMLGDLDSAREKFEESAKYALKFGNKRLVYSSQSELAHIQRHHGKLDEPLATYRDLLPKWNQLGHRAAVAHELECIAFILIKKEEPERAVTLLAAAETIRIQIDAPMTQKEKEEYEKEISILKAILEKKEFTAHWTKGRSMTMDKAIELALE